MAVQLSPHPSSETLVSFARGMLADDATVEVDAHLAECPTCRHAVATAEPDSFEARLKESRRSDTTPEPPHRLDPSGWSQGSGTAYQVAPKPLSPELLSGAVELVGLPDYELIRKLGQGGMGAVYLARNTLANQQYALKVISPAFLANPGAEGRFRQEIQAAIALGHHPNIVTAATAFRHGGALILAMEYIEGHSVDEELKKRSEQLPIAHACSYVAQAALGLAHAHEKGMVHRDVKPSNLMLTKVNGKHVVKVLDFGLAKPGGSDATGLTETGWAMGTPDFVAPEQARDARRADARSDIYSLGCTLYYLLAKQPPFPGGTAVEKIMRHVGEEPASIASLRSDVPEELVEFLSRMLAKDPADRPSSAREVVKALAPYTKLKPTTVPVSPRPDSVDSAEEAVSQTGSVLIPELPSATKAAPSIPPQSRRLRAIAIGAGVAMLLVAVLIGAWAGGVFAVKTKDGTIELRDLADDAVVTVDGQQIEVSWGADRQNATIRATPGQHDIQVERDGVTAAGGKVTVLAGETTIFSARFVPDPQTPEPNPIVIPTASNLPPVSDELLVNGDCSAPKLEGWTIVQGKWFQKMHGSGLVFCAGLCWGGVLRQDVDVTNYAAAIDAGRVEFRVTGRLASFDADRSQLMMFFLDADGKELKLGYDTGQKAHRDWTSYQGADTAPAGTRLVRVELRSHMSPRPGNKECSGYLDDISLKAVIKPTSPPLVAGAFVPLFNGKDLTGFSQDGGKPGQWKVDEATLVGNAATSGTSDRTYLLTDRDYSDFVLRFEFQLDKGSESGVAVRAIPGEKMRQAGGSLYFDHPVIKLHATAPGSTQFAPTGNSYWVRDGKAPTGPDLVRPIESERWHRMQVAVHNEQCTVLLNGELVADLRLNSDQNSYRGMVPALARRSGRVGFQAHTGTIRLRNLEISPTVAEVGFVPLFNNMDLTGWEPRRSRTIRWSNENGTIVGRNSSSDLNSAGVLVSDKQFKDFHLRCEVQATTGSETAQMLLFRNNDSLVKGARRGYAMSNPAPTAPCVAQGWGYGSLYADDFQVPPHACRLAQAKHTDLGIKYGDWYQLEVIACGETIIIRVNGKQTVEFSSKQPALNRAGSIVLRCHAGVNVAFRNLMVKDLTPEEGYVPLFNGKDLTGWKETGNPGGWSVKDGEIVADAGKPTDEIGRSGWLMTEKEYTNFLLRLEFAAEFEGNSGVGFRCDPTNVRQAEVQIFDESSLGKPVPDIMRTGALHGLAAHKALPDLTRGSWHTMELEVIDRGIKVTIDGTVCLNSNLDLYVAEAQKAEKSGFWRKSGPIGLQKWYSVVRFRNIRVKELP